ncbi:Uma2 family endonuclease [Pseudanabaena sp. FACHB-1277]|uniref:Uma2 family endonuclease n=1 Tax=Pseudanabaena cinerea FACHB-1277 TaxID=2949581 RepID=A0A926Z635_9CYAN|nr:Uma2 family endonuclease [Pseudanabaena cinerea]MBD2150260.1 Uma2 family endonuclease [Pseudanabaena cinerea FACHB-1277]
MNLATLPRTSVDLELITLPNQDQLPYEDGETMETQRHKMQMDLLIEGLDPWLEKREDGYVGGNMFIYFSQAQLKNQDFKGPDFFAVTGVSKKERKSWVVWEEEKAPDVVIELLSPSTANFDKTEKKQIYQNKMRVSEFFWYDPFDSEDFAGFSLNSGTYQPIVFNEQGWLISQSLGLALVRWSGSYRGVMAVWLRWATLSGEVLLTGRELAEQERERAEQEHERAEQEHERAEQEHERAEQERERADRLAQKLRSLGVDLDAGI